MHSIVTTFRGDVIKVEVANFCAAMDTLIDQDARYLIGKDASVTTFENAMDKCLSIGAHSVHINSEEEHNMMKQYISNSGNYCLLDKSLPEIHIFHLTVCLLTVVQLVVYYCHQ